MVNLGIVVIGRNEGKRLVRCLQSIKTQFPDSLPIVYVDSGSIDDSVTQAQTMGVDVISLDTTLPFTMARGRNTGLKHLVQTYPEIRYVQFIDGDCELISGWIDQAMKAISSDETLAVVCGRRRERLPNASVYNRLADMEWNTPVGDASTCGGDALIRVSAIQQAGAYNPSLICGEEPEMCIRFRQLGWKILRIEADMTLHDLNMYHFSQWWQRMIRGGWFTAEGFAMYGQTEERYMVREFISGWLWGVAIPMLAIAFAWPTHALSLLLLLGYPYLMYRIYSYRCSYGDEAHHALLYAKFITLSKFPQVIGQIKFFFTQWKQQTPKLIEYKTLT